MWIPQNKSLPDWHTIMKQNKVNGLIAKTPNPFRIDAHSQAGKKNPYVLFLRFASTIEQSTMAVQRSVLDAAVGPAWTKRRNWRTCSWHDLQTSSAPSQTQSVNTWTATCTSIQQMRHQSLDQLAVSEEEVDLHLLIIQKNNLVVPAHLRPWCEQTEYRTPSYCIKLNESMHMYIYIYTSPGYWYLKTWSSNQLAGAECAQCALQPWGVSCWSHKQNRNIPFAHIQHGLHTYNGSTS